MVAVRLAFHGKALEAAQLEAVVYQRLKNLQGRHVPRLVAHGYTCAGAAYFVATEYVKVVFCRSHGQTVGMANVVAVKRSQCTTTASAKVINHTARGIPFCWKDVSLSAEGLVCSISSTRLARSRASVWQGDLVRISVPHEMNSGHVAGLCTL